MLGMGSTAFWSTLFTVLRTVSACSASSGLMAVSTFAIISVAGMLVGVTAKFSPFLSRVVSASLSVLEDRLMTQFVWSTLVSRLTCWLLSVRGEVSRIFVSVAPWCCWRLWVLVSICSRRVFSLELTKIYQEGFYFLLLRNLWILELWATYDKSWQLEFESAGELCRPVSWADQALTKKFDSFGIFKRMQNRDKNLSWQFFLWFC